MHHKNHHSHNNHDKKHFPSNELTPEEVRQEAEEISLRIWNEGSHKNDKKKSPFWIVIAPVIALLIILMIVPNYAVKLDPSPKNIPSLDEVIPEINLAGLNKTASSRENILSYIDANNPLIKQIATTVSAKSCPSNRNCYAKALYYFVRDNIKYVNDPPQEYYEHPLETLKTGGADCDGTAILLANLMESIGITTRFVFIPGHVYVQIYLNDARKKYKQTDGWISLDPTCKNCEFSKTPYSTVKSEKTYVGGN